MSVSKKDEPNRSNNLFLNAGKDLDSENDFVETNTKSDLSFVVPDDASLYSNKDILLLKNKDRAIDTPEVIIVLKLKSKSKSIPKSKAKAIGKVAISILIGSTFMFYTNLLRLLLGLC
jgi:hypothetical protein